MQVSLPSCRLKIPRSVFLVSGGSRSYPFVIPFYSRMLFYRLQLAVKALYS